MTNEEMLEILSRRFDALDERIVKLNITLQHDIQPKIVALAEGHEVILDRLVPRSRVDELEDEVQFLKTIIRQLNDDIQNLKKAQ